MFSTQQILGTDTSHLVAFEHDDGHRMTASAVKAFSAMQTAAAADGVDCQIVSSYRGFATQSVIWQKKWLGQRPILDDDDQPLDVRSFSDEHKLVAILRWSALPGGSRHHWGTDCDVFDARAVKAQSHHLQLVADEYLHDGVCAQLFQWLQEHAEQFDFYFPYATDHGGVGVEPWHISYRPQAESIINNYNAEALQHLISHSDLEGKHIILQHLPMIVHRFIKNNTQDDV